MRHIFIYGPPASGKSLIGKLLAKKLNYDFFDIDVRISESMGMEIPQIMISKGEEEFRNLESREILAVSSSKRNRPAVVALGGGALLRQENREVCEKNGRIVFLDLDAQTLLIRLRQQEGTRPLLMGDVEAKLLELLQARKDHYDSFSFRIDKIGEAKVEIIVDRIQTELGIFYLQGMGTPYYVEVRPGALAALGMIASELGVVGKAVFVFDENTHRIFSQGIEESLKLASIDTHIVVLPAGEENKNLKSVERLWDAFIKAGLDRTSVVFAVGGGVISDLTGFAVSTFMRGCNWVCLPTTLLSMVDASIGGKTGFDLPQGKNLVGSFYPPKLVVIDPTALKTLPHQELISGMAEVIKHGIISDPILFEECSHGLATIQENFEDLIKQAVKVKVDVIEEDPFENGKRASLNLGHTIGHAVEMASKFHLTHGEAIAIGLVAESRLAEKMGLAETGLTEKIEVALKGFGLPTSRPENLSNSELIGFMRNDKKKAGQMIHFALPVRIGEVRTGVAIENLEEVL